MEATSSKPKVVVIDSMCRLKNFTCPQTEDCKEKLSKIKAVGKPFGSDDAIGDKIPCFDVKEFYNYKEFSDGTVFEELELPRPPEPAHVGVDGTVPPRVRWQYHYLQTFFASGTHYIILDSKHDCPDLTALGPYGYMCANGQGIMFDRLRGRIQNGESIVMLHNTGGVVQAFASLRMAMLSRIPGPEPTELLEKLELVSPQRWAQDFGLPEILMMKELHDRAPMLLKTTVMQVDLLEDGVGKVLNTVTACFSGGGGLPELGLQEDGAACILTAWKRHMTLMYNAKQFEAVADKLTLTLYFLAVFITLCSTLYSMENNGTLVGTFLEVLSETSPSAVAAAAAQADLASGEELNASAIDAGPLPDYTLLGYSVLLLPITAALISTIRARQRPREKWATCLMAASQIIDQIYKYRLRVDKYDTQKAPPPNPDGSIPDIPLGKREMMARRLFVDTCSEIYTNAISTEVAKGGALKTGKAGKTDTTTKEGREEFEVLVRGHVQDKLHASITGIEKNLKMGKTASSTKDAAPAAGAALAGNKAGLLGMVSGLLGGKKSKVGVVAMASGGMPPGAAGAMGAAGGVGALGDVGGMMDAATAAVQEAAGDSGGGGGNDDNTSGEIDDLVSRLSIDTYIACRVRPLAAYLEKRALVLSKRNQLLEFSVVTLQTAGSVLAVINQSDWIVITVALSSQCMALIDYFYIPSQLSSTNKALENVHNLISWWDSLSVIQAKTRAAKSKACSTVEGSLLEICSARTAMPSTLASEQADETEE